MYRIKLPEEDGLSTDEYYSILVGPDGFECVLKKSLDADSVILNELNKLYKENQELKQIGKVHGLPFSRDLPI